MGGICDQPFLLWPQADLFASIAGKAFPVLDEEKGRLMQEQILAAAAQADSVGGVIECAAIGLRLVWATPCSMGWKIA